jgi:uncharacterized protein DUF6934
LEYLFVAVLPQIESVDVISHHANHNPFYAVIVKRQFSRPKQILKFAWKFVKMNLDSYTYKSSESFKSYEFESDGPNGKVTKVISYTRIDVKDTEATYYNLGFGDLDKETGTVSDIAITNNKDRPMVLSTVAKTVLDFSQHHGKHFIFVKGSTPARTRLYQIGVSGIWDEIKEEFELYGLKDQEWKEFEKNVNYEAFLIRKK